MTVTFENQVWNYADLEVRNGNNFSPEQNQLIVQTRLQLGDTAGPYNPQEFLYWRKKADVDGTWTNWVDEATGYDDKIVEI